MLDIKWLTARVKELEKELASKQAFYPMSAAVRVIKPVLCEYCKHQNTCDQMIDVDHKDQRVLKYCSASEEE